ncbi:MAG: MFS transporter [Candidatus Aenigmarchaeota archaeon]|nr:MFS transporter [Candidatus Aenigmarchaeota archaeon]
MKKFVKQAFILVAVFGLVSLLGDIIYEGARGINGQYLQILGASAAIIGIFTGLGEFFGYALRAVSGYISDKTKSYWLLTILGYTLLVSVPLLAFAGNWQLAIIFIIIERIGKAIRSPARDTIISYAAKKFGTGLGFGIHEFFDQIGALIGPLLISIVFLNFKTISLVEYQYAYSLLFIPFLLLIVFLFFAYFLFKGFRIEKERKRKEEKFSRVFWFYIFFTFVTTLGFINFVILGYHFKFRNIIPEVQIPLLYSFAMLIDAITALFIGKAYDRLERKSKKFGLIILVLIPLLTLAIPFLVFVDSFVLIIFGILFFGIVMGSHETIMRAVIADITPISKRGSAYGIFTAFYGFASLIGSTLIGILYEISISYLVVFIFVTQFFALAIFYLLKKRIS